VIFKLAAVDLRGALLEGNSPGASRDHGAPGAKC
jgi:hypothetical protein